MQVIVNNEEVNQLQEATGVSYEEAHQAYIVSDPLTLCYQYNFPNSCYVECLK